jgi:peptidoglycan hydrolase-like protein with peptidoglycan-binding domain
MSQKIIRLTEADLNRIVKKIIKESDFEHENLIRGVQKFLNEKLKTRLKIDGKTGPNSDTEKAISKYQLMIGVYPVDGIWGEITESKMPKRDAQRLKDLIAEEGGIIDTFLNNIGL